MSHILFELNYKYHCRVFFKDEVDFYSKSRFVNKLTNKLRELIQICCQNLFYIQKLLKKVSDEKIKNQSDVFSNKVWLNNKYIKTKQNQKFGNKSFSSFCVFYIVIKQSYKLKLLSKQKIYDIFSMLLLEQNTRKEGQVN